LKVRYSKTALRELDDIFSYIYEHNRAAAAAVVDRIEKLTGMLEAFSSAGQLTDEPDVRFVAVVRYPFRIFYTRDDVSGDIVTLHVRHTARKFPDSND
jgi:toxin ParE1/3/4